MIDSLGIMGSPKLLIMLVLRPNFEYDCKNVSF